MKKTRSRLEILNQLLSFPTISNTDWTSMKEPKIGDLVSLNCAPTTKWYVSWVLETRGDEYLLESIDDGTTCWWSNVGLNIYNKEKIRYNWRWTDDQFEFMDRWFRVGKKNDAYIVLCVPPIFDGNNVTLRTRIRFNMSETFDGNPKTFSNWKKLKSSEMDAYYKESVKKYEALKPITAIVK